MKNYILAFGLFVTLFVGCCLQGCLDDVRVTNEGTQVTFDDGTGYWLEY